MDTIAASDVLYLDPADPIAIDGYLLARGLAGPDELPCLATRAGDGNMNVTLRITLRDRTLILKQGRPWVAKYEHIAAPWERTLVEGAFYEAVRGVTAVASRMPRLLHLDAHHHVLALEDLGSAGDFTYLYRDPRVGSDDLGDLLAWLDALPGVSAEPAAKGTFKNRAMRALNHEHIFRLPLSEENGLDLDRLAPGLADAAAVLKRDPTYRLRVEELGSRYLDDGDVLVHGDYFPGSWVRTPAGVRVIDPEFCFLGAREFDYGVMLAHLALAVTDVEAAERVVAAGVRGGLDELLLLGFAGAEVMRRLIGVAQLPLAHGIDQKRRLLELSRSLVVAPERGLAWWS